MSHRIVFIPSQLNLIVEENETILQAAAREGIQVPRACDAGTCQLCAGTLLKGSVRVKHSPVIIDACASSQPVFCCISYPLQDIKIEVPRVLAPGQLPCHEISAQITDIEQVSADVKVVQLRLPAGKKIDFYPGQYLEVILDAENRAAFSIASAPRKDRTLELHIRETQDSTSYPLLAQRLNIGELLTLKLPNGETTLIKLKDAKRIILLAASTGFSQMKAILEGMIAAQDFRPVSIYWGARSAEDLYQHDTMLALAKTHSNICYVPVVSGQAGWVGRKGLVHKALLEDETSFDQCLIVCGGSPAMVYNAFDDCIAAGMKAEQMLSDVFAYAPRN